MGYLDSKGIVNGYWKVGVRFDYFKTHKDKLLVLIWFNLGIV